MKTFMAKNAEEKDQKWFLIDAEGKILGRLATRIAMILMGKHRPDYTPHVDLGDHVVVINAKKIKFTGTNKGKQKIYQTYSGYTAGLKEWTLEEMMERKPEAVISEAVRRMLPKNYLAHRLQKKLRVFAGSEHRHAAQNPEVLSV